MLNWDANEQKYNIFWGLVMTYKILAVEDVPVQQKLLSRCLSLKGYACVFAETGNDAVKKAAEQKPDLILLDLYLPDMDGIKVCETLRSNKKTAGIPIIMLTARGDVKDIVNGLKTGADDYMSKPYNYQELLARIDAILRRSERNGNIDEVIKKGTLKLFPDVRKVMVGKKTVDAITRKEFDLLALLLRKSPQILDIKYLMDTIWGENASNDPHTLDTHIYNIRKKLGDPAGSRIKSVYGFGYKFE